MHTLVVSPVSINLLGSELTEGCIGWLHLAQQSWPEHSQLDLIRIGSVRQTAPAIHRRRFLGARRLLLDDALDSCGRTYSSRHDQLHIDSVLAVLRSRYSEQSAAHLLSDMDWGVERVFRAPTLGSCEFMLTLKLLWSSLILHQGHVTKLDHVTHWLRNKID